MVEQSYILDAVFKSLSDPIRRDILARVRERDMNVSEIAVHYDLSFAGVAKHLTVLERAGLVSKTKRGKEQIVTINPKALAAADRYIESYREVWEKRLDALDAYLTSTKHKK
jgi:DNA-binding transcriptional ArsR family regulator